VTEIHYLPDDRSVAVQLANIVESSI